MVVHQGAAALHGETSLHADPVVVRVTRPDELPAALAQRTKPVVINNAAIERSFSVFERWRAVRFLGALLAAVIALAIAQRYKIDFSWSLNWKVERLDGKITLTPMREP
jgi:hypothetical protein